MKSIQQSLHLRYEAFTRAQQQFAEKGEFRVEIYQGTLEVDNQHDFKHLATYPFEQQFSGQSTTVPAVKRKALPLFKSLFNTNVAKAIKLLFY